MTDTVFGDRFPGIFDLADAILDAVENGGFVVEKTQTLPFMEDGAVIVSSAGLPNEDKRIQHVKELLSSCFLSSLTLTEEHNQSLGDYVFGATRHEGKGCFFFHWPDHNTIDLAKVRAKLQSYKDLMREASPVMSRLQEKVYKNQLVVGPVSYRDKGDFDQLFHALTLHNGQPTEFDRVKTADGVVYLFDRDAYKNLFQHDLGYSPERKMKDRVMDVGFFDRVDYLVDALEAGGLQEGHLLDESYTGLLMLPKEAVSANFHKQRAVAYFVTNMMADTIADFQPGTGIQVIPDYGQGARTYLKLPQGGREIDFRALRGEINRCKENLCIKAAPPQLSLKYDAPAEALVGPFDSYINEIFLEETLSLLLEYIYEMNVEDIPDHLGEEVLIKGTLPVEDSENGDTCFVVDREQYSWLFADEAKFRFERKEQAWSVDRSHSGPQRYMQ